MKKVHFSLRKGSPFYWSKLFEVGVLPEVVSSLHWEGGQREGGCSPGGGEAVAIGLDALPGDFQHKDSLSLLDNTNSLCL